MKLYLPPSLLLGSLDKVQDKNDLHRAMSVHSYFCDLVSESKLFVTFFFFKFCVEVIYKKCQVSMSLLEIRSVTLIFYVVV